MLPVVAGETVEEIRRFRALRVAALGMWGGRERREHVGSGRPPARP
jgi:hypothetical protein